MLRRGGIPLKRFQTSAYRMLELLVWHGANGSVTVEALAAGNSKQQRVCVSGDHVQILRIPLECDTEYSLDWQGVDISLAYLSGHPDIRDGGVLFLELEDVPDIGQSDGRTRGWYDHPYREQYHFSPYKNWMNDPNGLCWFDGYYHLFYQANPFEQKWGNMYWGHAVSKDLLRWKHLPYVFEPQQELLGKSELVGGAFSGSAVPLDDRVDLFFTRSIQAAGGKAIKEYQVVSSTRDMLEFSPEETIIAQGPPSATEDFRDPKVFRMDNRWFMVLGSKYRGEAAILLYESEDLRSWCFLHPLLTEQDPSIRAMECPDCFFLDGKYVVITALMAHTDSCGRFQMSKYYIGHFDGTQYIVEHSGWFDFVGNIYGVQSFEHENRRIAVGWISDFYGEQPRWDNGAYGSTGLPRLLRLENGRLFMEPLPELETLQDQLLFERCGNVPPTTVEGNSYHCKVSFSNETDCDILLGQEDEKEIHLIQQDGVTRLQTIGVQTEGIHFISDAGPVLQLDIYVDRRLTEVFINGGECVGAKLFYTGHDQGIFALSARHPSRVSGVTLHTMHSIW